jgi:hypothetical protein
VALLDGNVFAVWTGSASAAVTRRINGGARLLT